MFDTEESAFEQDLARVAQARREQQHLLVQREAGRAEVAQATDDVERARGALSDEHGDAQQLASLTFTSVAAMLRGTRDDQLREQLATREAARLAFLAAEERLAQALADLARVEDRLVALGDVDAERLRLEEAQRRWAVNEDIVVVVADLGKRVLQAELPTERRNQLDLRTGQVEAGRGHEEVLDR